MDQIRRIRPRHAEWGSAGMNSNGRTEIEAAFVAAKYRPNGEISRPLCDTARRRDPPRSARRQPQAALAHHPPICGRSQIWCTTRADA